MNKKLLLISLEAQEVGAAVGMYDGHRVLNGAPASRVDFETRNATPELTPEEQSIKTQDLTRMVDVRSGNGGSDVRSTEPDSNEEQSMETPEGIETYSPSPVWEHRAVGIAATWWSELVRC